jgi:hypothetical protein
MLIPPYGYQQQVESILQVEQTRTKVQGLQKKVNPVITIKLFGFYKETQH